MKINENCNECIANLNFFDSARNESQKVMKEKDKAIEDSVREIRAFTDAFKVAERHIEELEIALAGRDEKIKKLLIDAAKSNGEHVSELEFQLDEESGGINISIENVYIINPCDCCDNKQEV